MNQMTAKSELLQHLYSFTAPVEIQSNELSFMAIPASIANAETMYLQKTMQQQNKNKFLQAMVKEIENYTRKGHWHLLTKKK